MTPSPKRRQVPSELRHHRGEIAGLLGWIARQLIRQITDCMLRAPIQRRSYILYAKALGCGIRGACIRVQSMPARSADNCAAFIRMTPSTMGCHLKPLLSSRFQYIKRPSQTTIFTRSAHRRALHRVMAQSLLRQARQAIAPLRICGAPHNRNYVEPTIMQSVRPFDPRPALLSTI